MQRPFGGLKLAIYGYFGGIRNFLADFFGVERFWQGLFLQYMIVQLYVGLIISNNYCTNFIHKMYDTDKKGLFLGYVLSRWTFLGSYSTM